MKYILIILFGFSPLCLATNTQAPQLIYQATLESCRYTVLDQTDTEQESLYLLDGLPGHKLGKILTELSQSNQLDRIKQITESRAFAAATKDCYPQSLDDQLHFKFLVENQYRTIIEQKLAILAAEMTIGFALPSVILLKLAKLSMWMSKLTKWSTLSVVPLITSGSSTDSRNHLQSFYLNSLNEKILTQKNELNNELNYHIQELEFLIKNRCHLESENCQDWKRAHSLYLKLITNQ